MKFPYPILHKKFKSFDGTSIGYQVIGKGKKTVILCNGLGGTALAYKPFYDYFGGDYRFISWDYRGLFRSECPEDTTSMTIDDHMRDIECLLGREKIKKALFVGWSMGVQICLEFYRQHPEHFSGMILMNGTYGRPFHTALNSSISRYLLPHLNEVAHKIMPALQPRLKPLAERFMAWKGSIPMLSRAGFVHRNIDADIIREVAKEMFASDLQIYHVIMRHLSEHDAGDILPKVKVPTLVIAGGGDRITPLKVSKRMEEKIPKAQLFIVPHGTHYAILEFPEMINLRVDKFLKENYPA